MRKNQSGKKVESGWRKRRKEEGRGGEGEEERRDEG